MANIPYIISYQPDFSNIVAGFRTLSSLNAKLSKQLQTDLGSAFNVQNLNITKLTTALDELGNPQQIGKFSASIKDASGNLKTLSSDFIITANAGKDAGSSLKLLNQTIKDGGVQSKFFGVNLGELAKRAALTIPIWFALRTAIIGIPQAIIQSFNALAEFDKLLQKTKFNLQGFADVESAIDQIRERITALSIETGVSTEQITLAFERFVSAGFDIETAFAGATGAVKTSIALFGDAGQAADTFAAAFKVLVDESENAIPPQEQILKIFAQTAELAKSNVFTFDEFRESLEKFAATAKIANFTQQQTIALLATLNSAAVKGSRGGTLLRTAVQQLVGNLDDVANELGIQVNPQLDNTFDVLVKVVNATSDLNKASKITAETTPILAEIFGGIRGTEIAQALIAVRKTLEENLTVLGDFTKLSSDVDSLNDSLSGQVRIFKNLTKEIGKTFVSGLIGGDSFAQTLERINGFLEKTRVILGGVGTALRFTFLVGRGDFDGLSNAINEEIQKVASAAPKAFEAVSSNIFTNFNKALKGSLSKVDTKNTLDTLEVFGADLLQIDPATFDRMREVLQKSLNENFQNQPVSVQVSTIFEFQQELFKEQLKSKSINEDIITDLTKQLAIYQKLAETGRLTTEQQKTFNDLQKSLLTSLADQQNDINNVLLQNAVERAKAEGATTSQIIKATQAYRTQLGIDTTLTQQVSERLQLEQAINQERKLQNKLSNDSIKLFEIAKTEGVDVAKTIGNVLAGNIDFGSFFRQGGEALEVFKREFQDLFQSQQAQAFFQGNFLEGFQELRGGTNIPIADRGALTRTTPRFDTNLAIQQAKTNQAQLQQLQNINVNAGLDINITGLSFDQAREKIIDEVARAIFNKIKTQSSNPQSEFSQAVRTRFNEE